MPFKKAITIYEKGEIKIYINQCHNPGRKTWLYSMRKDSSTGFSELLGLIKWKGSWRQYCFYPENNTFWSAKCNQGITDFLMEINQVQRDRWRKK